MIFLNLQKHVMKRRSRKYCMLALRRQIGSVLLLQQLTALAIICCMLTLVTKAAKILMSFWITY